MLPVIFYTTVPGHAAVSERVVVAAVEMIRVVIRAPPQGAARDQTLVHRVDEIALVVVPRSPVVKDRGAPGDRLRLIVIGEGGRDGPVPPGEIREEVIAFFAVHIDRLPVVVLRSV